MDKETRNLVQRATQEARRLLEREYAEQLEALYDVLPDSGHIGTEPGPHLDAQGRFVRERIIAAIVHERATVATRKDAIAAYLRETSFTTLNRFAALKLMEARRIVQECVSKGEQSAGFREFSGLAAGLGDLPDHGYRLYLECLFDEIGVEVGALFDRRHPSGLLWPRRPALLELLEILNRPALALVWLEDETIGWIYQYFNDDAERQQMRKESAAPRNSRELAVRNQFFTPRYVVQFLTDNTLGRLWHEMRQGQTRIQELCRFLIVPSPEHCCERLKKDPRALKVIDPACGSMHFGLYAFDVLTAIYLEAWNDLPDSELRRDYPDIEALRRDIPKFIIERNLHGIDIDPRATQIAGFALWLRAQRAWAELQLPASARPRIERSSIVCAEPMAGGADEIRQFVDSAFGGRREKPAFQLLLTRIQESMRLAGEAGSLLRIEDEIPVAITEAKRMATEGPKFKQVDFLASSTVPAQAEIPLDLSGLTDDEFWTRAEQELLDALASYSETFAGGLHSRLFAQDAARGIGFIHLCRQKYDVALMNPPFGDASIPSKPYIEETYGDTKGDVYKAFVECFQDRLQPAGYLGIISSRTGFFLGQSEDWRTRVVLRLFRPIALADLGSGVLDAMVEVAAYVLRSLSVTEARDLTLSLVPVLEKVARDKQDRFSLPKWQAARDGLKRHQAVAELEQLEAAGFIQRSPGDIVRYTPLWHAVKKIPAPPESVFPPLVCIRALEIQDKGAALAEAVSGSLKANLFVCDPGGFAVIPTKTFAYWAPPGIRRVFLNLPRVENGERMGRLGVNTTDDFRFLRLYWEVAPTNAKRRWMSIFKGGGYRPFFNPSPLVMDWEESGKKLKALIEGRGDSPSRNIRSESLQGRRGLTYSSRTQKGLGFQPLPAGSLFTVKGPGIFASDVQELVSLLALMNSVPFRFLVSLQMAFGSFEIGVIQRTPLPVLSRVECSELAKLALGTWRTKRVLDTPTATSHAFVLPALLPPPGNTLAERGDAWAARVRTSEESVAAIQAEIDNLAFRLYGLDAADRAALTATLDTESSARENDDTSTADEDEDGNNAENAATSADAPALVADLLAYVLGAAFGRWDVRLATGQRPAPPEPDPFDPLPICPPGMLQNEQGLPAAASEAPADYPLRITWSGIIVDDHGNPEDIETRTREVLQLIWGDGTEGIEAEACQILGVKTLRDYFRKEFFTDHLKRYSKSRRQAPIYWPLSTSSGSYTIWLYYHRFTKDTFYRVREIADEKFRHEERKFFTLQQEAAPNPSTGQAKALAVQEKVVEELREFRAEVARVAPLWNPNLNDGVIINFAPFHRLISHAKWRKDVTACWETLVAGEYDWAHLALHLWPERVIAKCLTDRSLAIAHDLDEVFWGPDPEKEGKFIPKIVPKVELDRLIAERTSSAVKSALQSLANQPPRGPARRRSRA